MGEVAALAVATHEGGLANTLVALGDVRWRAGEAARVGGLTSEGRVLGASAVLGARDVVNL